jgi:GxxExxY protein
LAGFAALREASTLSVLANKLKDWRIAIVTENDIAREIVSAAYEVHKRLGPGLLESVYEVVLSHELQKRGLDVSRQVPVSFTYDGMTFDEGFRADLMVNDSVIVELKSVEQVLPVHKKQLLTYLRLADKRLGLLINFGAPLIRDGLIRIVNQLPE